jgi:flagellar L-ring protein precursor FlgH
MARIYKFTFAFLLLTVLCSCEYSREKFSSMGSKPELTDVNDPKVGENYKNIEWQEGKDDYNQSLKKPHVKYSSSLWQPGAKYFFRDQRARRVGDILKVIVSVQDTATLDTSADESRATAETLGVPNLFGIEKSITKKGHMDVNNLAGIKGSHSATGAGKISRKEDIRTEVAAMVTQILPNGNLVIRGTQEMRVNYEVREITVAGIVRPEDITAENSISSEQIAEARISYGGHGHLNNMQQPRWGTQILDAFAPF